MNYPQELTGTYDIYEQIGAGGGGTVYRAVHKRLRKTVVLKKITGGATSIQECRTEVDILKNLRHSYLPQVLDFIESSEGIYTVMDFIPGKSMRQMLEEGHIFTEKEVLKYARQLCEALDYLHSQNPPIVHGDIKPDNIMVTPEGNVCLIDFNISGILEGQGARTFGYTPGYSSPEQIAAYEEARRRMLQPSGMWQGAPAFGCQPVNMPCTAPGGAAGADRTAILGGGTSDQTAILGGGASDRTAILGQGNEGACQRGTQILGAQFAGVQQPWGNPAGVTPYNVSVGVQQPWGSPAGMPPQAGILPQPGVQPFPGIVIDRRSDIFSLGATLYTLLTGRILDLSAPVPVLPHISDGFMIVLAKALDRNPDRRYQDAGKMLQAVVQVHKKDKKYKSLLRKQELASVAVILLLAVSVFMIVEGRRRMGAENRGYYYELVGRLDEAATSGMDEAEFEEIYQEATGMYPQYADAYYDKARYLFETGDYEKTVSYIGEILTMQLEGTDEMWGNLYHLYAECYFRLEDYQTAKSYYQTSLNYSRDNPIVYRDYAISLVYLDQTQQAEELLGDAISRGMQQADVYMVQGEIERLRGDAQAALECFAGVLEEATDEYLIQRAYVMGSRAYGDIGTEEALVQDTRWLQEGIARLSMSSRLLLYERLAQDYISLGEMTQDNTWYGSAVETFQEICNMGWATYVTYSNMVVLCQRMEDLENAGKWAQEMAEKYPENYVSYMRLAYLEIERQNAAPKDERDYHMFEQYYRTAREYYEQQTSGNVTDAEMQLLDNQYQRVVEGGWLE